MLNFGGRTILGLNHETRERANGVKNTMIFNAFVFCQVRIRHSQINKEEKFILVLVKSLTTYH